MTIAYEEFHNYTHITNNHISSNNKHGIYCIGKNNKTYIVNNPFIGLNEFCGIKADLEADIVIKLNDIVKNMH